MVTRLALGRQTVSVRAEHRIGSYVSTYMADMSLVNFAHILGVRPLYLDAVGTKAESRIASFISLTS